MEELVPIVAKLSKKYTANESTSITYEKAEQLMSAVLYCIQEVEQFEHNSMISTDGISAQQAYEIGFKCVEEKTKKALDLYNEILSKFICYENRCLYDTFVKGLPEFFKNYDIQFEPQNTILTIDYPVLKDISEYVGIDKVYEFIKCIQLEQKFLNSFPKDYIINVLSKYNRQYKDMIDNICEIVLMSVVVCILANKSLSESTLETTDYLHIQKIFMQTDLNDINKQLKSTFEVFVKKYYKNCNELLEYILNSISDITIRLKNAIDNGLIYQIL